MSPVEIQQLWKEVAAQSGLQDENKSHFNGLTSTRSQSLQALPTWTNSLTNHVSPISGIRLIITHTDSLSTMCLQSQVSVL